MTTGSEVAGEGRVLMVVPTRRDGETTCALLARVGLACRICNDLSELNRELVQGAGALLLTDVALSDPGMTEVLQTLQAQPAWSDVPVVVLSRERDRSSSTAAALGVLTNVTLLDFPSSARTMVSAVESALRARRRQYQIRDQLIRQQRAEEALRDADLRKDEFLATLAHELRNPLATICTGLQVVRAKAAEQGHAGVLEMMDRQSRTLVKLVDELLEVTRIATGKVVLDAKALDLREVVESALETASPLTGAASHDLRVELPASPVQVLGDAVRLTQIVSNLASNAAKYTPAGRRITVSLTEKDGHAVLRVADDGVGIPAEMLGKVFDMFTQVNQTLDRAQGGLGIGLALVRRLLELHGGTIDAASEGVDRGSTFTVRLPLVAPVAQPLAAVAEPTDIPAKARPLRFLVVDDNPDVGDVLAVLLNNFGHETHTEYGGAAAIAAAASFRPDVVFCDIGMPEIDGCEVATRLRADGRFADTLLIALTGWGAEKDKRRTRDAGFDLHLTKPVAPADLMRVLEQAAPRRLDS